MKKFIAEIWKFKIVWLILLLLPLFFIAPHTGKRGALLFFLSGSFLYTFSLTLYYFVTRKIDLTSQKKNIFIQINPALISTILACAICFIMFKLYGVRSVFLWAAFAGGIAVDAVFLVFFAKKVIDDNHIINIAKSFQQISYFHVAWIGSVILGLYRFYPALTGAAAAIYIIGFSFILAVIFNIAMNTHMDKKAYSIFYAIFSALLAAGIFMIINALIKDINYFYCAVCGIISAFIIWILFNREDEGLINTMLAVLIIIGNLWISFKFAAGFGLSLNTLGFLSGLQILQPMYIYDLALERSEGKEKSESIKIFEMAGLFLVLTIITRLFIQVSNLYEGGINLNNGYFIIGISLGLFLPVFIELGGILNPYRNGVQKNYSTFFASLQYLVLTILAKWSNVIVFIFLGLESVVSVLIGLSLAAAVSFVYLFKNKAEDNLWNTSLGSLWVFLGFVAFMMYPYKDMIGDISRMHKIGIIGIVLAIALGVYLMAVKNEQNLPR